MKVVEKYLQEINLLCKSHKVKHLYVFGSVLSDKFTAQSDIDLIVDFEDFAVEDYADNYYSLKFALEDTLHLSVDLLEAQAIKNPYFKENLDRQKRLIYG